MSDNEDKVVKLEGRRKKGSEEQKTLDQKWGKGTMSVGYTVLPVALLRGQARLKIGANELAVLVHLIDHWWKPDDMPWPSKRTIAERLGTSPKTVQRAIVKLENEGLLKRKERYSVKTKGRTSNEYDLSPLVERLKPIAADMSKAAEESKARRKMAERPGFKKRPSAAS
jgi:DNA-binding transcriptional regulator YhcF (GntR family)